MAGKDFSIEAKLKIAGVEVPGNLDAGTLKFKVDTSALDKLVQHAAKAAEQVKKKFENIKAVQDVIGKVQGQINAAKGQTLPSVNLGDLNKAIAKQGELNSKVREQLGLSKEVSAAHSQAAQKRIADIERIKKQIDALAHKELRLMTQLAGGGKGGGAIPPGGFGVTPPGGSGGGPTGGFGGGGESIDKLTHAMRLLDEQTRSGGRAMADLDQLAFEVGRKAAAFRGVAIAINTVVNAAQAAAQFIIQYNDSLRELNKILQFSNAGLQKVGNELFRISASTGVAVDETINIATEFARAGLEGRGYGTVAELTSKALLGLQGTTLDAAQATNIMIQVIQQVDAGAKGLNKELITTSKLFDILGKAEDITASQAIDVAEAFKRSAASLFATGTSVSEATALISVLQERTQRGGDVIGTALKTIATRTSDAASDAADALRKIGVETVDAQGNLRNTFAVLKDTADAFKNLTEAEQSNIAAKVAGVRQVEIFRAALLDFNRVQKVESSISNATGDAARKQAVEQEKLATAIKKTQIALQELVKNATEGVLGQLFAGAIKGAEKLLTFVANLDTKLGGVVSTFVGFLAIVGAAKALIPLFRGIFKAIQFFVGKEQEALTGMNQLGSSAFKAGSTIDASMNKSLMRTATLMREVNNEMKSIQMETQQAAIQAERLAKARMQAMKELGPKASQSAVATRTKDIMQQSDPTVLAAGQRREALTRIIGRGGSEELIRAAKTTPEAFSKDELIRIEQLNKHLSETGRLSTVWSRGLDRIGASLTSVVRSSIAWGVGLSLLSGLLEEASQKSSNAGNAVTGMALAFGGAAAQGAALGALIGGPFIAAIAGLVAGIARLSGFKDPKIEKEAEEIREETKMIAALKDQMVAEGKRRKEELNARNRLNTAMLADQKEAFGGLSMEMLPKLENAAKMIGTPVNKLAIEMRSFVASLEKEIMQLEEATIRAITPQRELASAMNKLAEKRLVSAEDSKAFGITDLQMQLAEFVNKLPAPESAIGSDAKAIEVRRSFTQALTGAIDDIVENRTSSPRDARAAITQRLQKGIPGFSIGTLNEDQQKELIAKVLEAGKERIRLETEIANAQVEVTRAKIALVKQEISEEQKLLSVDARRREAMAMSARVALEELTGIRQLVAQRKIEADLTTGNITAIKKTIGATNDRIAQQKEILARDKDNVAAQDLLRDLQESLTDKAIELERALAEERINGVRQTLAVAREAIDFGNRIADAERNQIAARSQIVGLLAIGQTEMERFNAKLRENSQTFRTTQAELAAEVAVVNATISDQTERQARLADIYRRAEQAALDAAQAEAQVISERREAIKQLTQEGLQNAQSQIDAQRSVFEATGRVAEAFESYQDAVDGAILATTQYNLNLALVESENSRLLGGFAGLKEQLASVQSIFRDAENDVRNIGASEKTLMEIRKQSIDQQLALFNQLLTEQSQLARSFFQSSADDQVNLFQGIQEASNVASLLGGSFDNFKKLGETAINDLGAQLLSLPQEVRQRVVSSLETLKQVGGQVGGFTADQLLTAIETASLGVSEEGLDVDPLFEIQQRIADLNLEQARIATDQLISSNEAIQTAKEQLEQAQAAKDLAEIQLERIKEEGVELRAKIGELQGSLQTILLQQDQTQRSGFDAVTRAINQTTAAVSQGLPDALSAKVSQAFRDVLSAGGLAVPGITSSAPAMATADSRGIALANDQRKFGSNRALQEQIFNSSGAAPIIQGDAAANAQQRKSNLPDDASFKQTNQTLDGILDELRGINTITTASQEVLTEIRDSSGATLGAVTATPANIPEINVTIEGEQRITVTGFEQGVATIIRGLTETFGGFVNETQAREIANQVVDSIRLQLERLGIMQRNQL